MTWKSYFCYIIATCIVAFLIAKMGYMFGLYLGLIIGVILGFFHIYISGRLAIELYNKSFSLKDRLIVGCSFPLSVLICFAAIYQQQGVICQPENLRTDNFFMCLKVSLGNFFGHMIMECQAAGDGVNLAHAETIIGALSLVAAGFFVALFLKGKIKEANKS